MDKKKIGICIHGFSVVDFKTYVNHLKCLGSWGAGYDLSLITCNRVKVAQARIEILKQAKEMDVEFLFFMDTDHRFDVSALPLLMQNMVDEVAMVSGVICRRGDSFGQIGYTYKDEKYYPIKLPLNGLSYEVGTCAFGCNIFRLEDALKLKHPIFADVMKARNDGSEFNMRSDVNFCHKLKEITGGKILINTRVQVGHVGEPIVVWPENSNIVKDLTLSGAIRI